MNLDLETLKYIKLQFDICSDYNSVNCQGYTNLVTLIDTIETTEQKRLNKKCALFYLGYENKPCQNHCKSPLCEGRQRLSKAKLLPYLQNKIEIPIGFELNCVSSNALVYGKGCKHWCSSEHCLSIKTKKNI